MKSIIRKKYQKDVIFYQASPEFAAKISTVASNISISSRMQTSFKQCSEEFLSEFFSEEEKENSFEFRFVNDLKKKEKNHPASLQRGKTIIIEKNEKKKNLNPFTTKKIKREKKMNYGRKI